MAYSIQTTCRKCSLAVASMLLLQFTFAQVSTSYDFSKADEWLKTNLKELGGRAVLVIYKGGELIYSTSGNGLTRRQKTVGSIIARRQGKDSDEVLSDFTAATKQRIASCSKWLSAALIMTFVDDGSLKLEDSIGKYLPVMTENGKGSITIRQCLSHLTGIKAGTIRETNEAMKNINSMDEAIELIAKQPMEGAPGKTFHYSSTGLQIGGAIIEKISGKDFETLFAERIARSCEMTQTDFGKGKVAMPAGSGWSTAGDYIKFLTMILDEGTYKGKRVLSKESVIEMQKNYVIPGVKVVYSPAEAGNWGYGLGEWVMDDAGAGKRSDAVTSPGLFGSFPWIDRKLEYAAFLLTFNINSKGRNDRYKNLKKIIDTAINK